MYFKSSTFSTKQEHSSVAIGAPYNYYENIALNDFVVIKCRRCKLHKAFLIIPPHTISVFSACIKLLTEKSEKLLGYLPLLPNQNVSETHEKYMYLKNEVLYNFCSFEQDTIKNKMTNAL